AGGGGGGGGGRAGRGGGGGGGGGGRSPGRGLPLATAQARRRAGAALAAAGQTEPAAAQLREAHEIFAGLGAGGAAGQCAAGLVALGRKPPRRARGGRRAGALSRRESEVMALVAQGLTSRDIRGRPFP